MHNKFYDEPNFYYLVSSENCYKKTSKYISCSDTHYLSNFPVKYFSTSTDTIRVLADSKMFKKFDAKKYKLNFQRFADETQVLQNFIALKQFYGEVFGS